MTNLEENSLDGKENFIIEDVLTQFIFDKKEQKGIEFNVLIEGNNVLEFGWFKEPEEGNTMYIRYTDHSTHCVNIPLNEPTFGEIKSVLIKFFGNF